MIEQEIIKCLETKVEILENKLDNMQTRLEYIEKQLERNPPHREDIMHRRFTI